MKGKLVPLKLIISYFLPHIKKYKRTFWTAFFGYCVGFIGASVIMPLFYRRIVDIISVAGGDTVIGGDKLLIIIYYVAITQILQNIAYRVADFTLTYSQSNILRELSVYSFQKIQHHSYKFFANTFQGSLVAKSRRFVRSFETLQDNFCYVFSSVTIQLCGIFIVLSIVAPIVSVFFAVWCVVYIIVTILFIRKRRIYDLETAAADSRVTATLADAITNILNIKVFASGKREIKLFKNVADNEEKMRRRAWYFGNTTALVQAVMLVTLEIVGLYMNIKLWREGIISGGTIILFQTYVVIIFGTMWNLGNAISKSIRALSEASEMVEIFERKPDILDPTNPEPCRIKEGKIVFDQATFAYSEGAPIVFSDFNLIIRPKEKVGIVGYSGVGKTTITKLLLRFVELSGGIITIDGQNIINIKQDDLRSKIAYVPQEPLLFHRPLKENISYGRPNATKEEIIKAAKDAYAHEFISGFPQGYETLVGERGVKLSGGERQRVAIARAILTDAPILMLDEATSSLDSVSEKFVQKALVNLMKNRTTLVVAHRLSTIQRMDRIIVLNSKGIAEEGTHAELLSKRGVYYNFWTHQSGGFIS